MERKEKVALFFMQDPGGTNNLLPVYWAFKGLCPDVLPVIIASGSAPAILKKLPGTEEMIFKDHHKDIIDVFEEYPDPVLVVTSMDSGVSLGRSAMSVYRDICSTVAATDTPWGRSGSTWKAQEFWPRYLIVNDGACKRVALDIWQGYPPESIVISPWPFLDRFRDFDVTQARAFRAKHCAIENYPIILFAGQVVGTAGVLKQFVEVLNSIPGDHPGDYYVVVRMHKRIYLPEYAAELQACQEALKLLKRNENGRFVADTSDFEMDPINYAARVTVSIHSITLVEKAAVRGYCISVQTPEGLAAYHQDIGEQPPYPPYGDMGICDVVKSPEALRAIIVAALQPGFVNPLAPKQSQVLPIDGKNAQRVAEFLKGLIQ